MGFLEQIREAARLAVVGRLDNWYFREYPYVLELAAYGLAPDELPGTSVYFVFPLGPEEYEPKRVFRSSVAATMGGIVAEEAGLLWVEFHIRGTFGLGVKASRDTTVRPDPPVAPGTVLVGGRLSGPGWTRRMIRNIFERYATLKADPDKGSKVRLIWHDMKLDEHWVVVPETVGVPRSVQRRAQYPYDIVMKGIARAEAIDVPRGSGALNGFGKIKQVLGTVNRSVQIVRASLREGARILNEIRSVIQGIDTILTDVNSIADAAQDFLDGKTPTIALGKTFLIDTADELQAALDSMEESTEIPNAVRQNYARALDGLYLLTAQAAAYGQTYEQQIAALQQSEAGAAADTARTLADTAAAGPAGSMDAFAARRERQNDQALVDAGATTRARIRSSYSGFREYAIRSVDTLVSIAAQQLGDGALWYDLAILNGLQAPYISPAGVPCTVAPGDIIVIPVISTDRATAVVAGEGRTTDQSVLGTDIALEEDSNSIPGSPVVVMRPDRRTYKDVAVVSGLDNFKQALQLRMWTELGSLPLVPGYGRPRQIGVKQLEAFLALLRLSTQQTLRQDSRVALIRNIQFEADNDLIELSVDVVPIGSTSARNVTLSLV